MRIDGERLIALPRAAALPIESSIARLSTLRFLASLNLRSPLRTRCSHSSARSRRSTAEMQFPKWF
jgi:hypothetical protein